MVGPSVTPYLVPVAAMLPIAFWLAMVFWASSHPVRGNSGAGQYPGAELPQVAQDTHDAQDAQPQLGVPEQRRAFEPAAAQERQAASQSRPGSG
jgi:hypothetical protein